MVSTGREWTRADLGTFYYRDKDAPTNEVGQRTFLGFVSLRTRDEKGHALGAPVYDVWVAGPEHNERVGAFNACAHAQQHLESLVDAAVASAKARQLVAAMRACREAIAAVLPLMPDAGDEDWGEEQGMERDTLEALDEDLRIGADYATAIRRRWEAEGV